ncbi:MAG: NUDIX domain-containing protein [Candidatus Latescibacteria bacterium]|nr:NUDIX domain-containing protein [Candidatus Latescibacterota bacterium]
MPRAPFNAFTYPYRRVAGGFEYALLKRADSGFWHGASGGGEDDETPLQGAQRETFEETGIDPDSLFLQLDTVAFIPVTGFRDSPLWGEDVYVIPQYYFGVLTASSQLVLSDEHFEFKWVGYEEAYGMLHFDSDRNALWELNQRLRGLGPRG